MEIINNDYTIIILKDALREIAVIQGEAKANPHYSKGEELNRIKEYIKSAIIQLK